MVRGPGRIAFQAARISAGLATGVPPISTSTSPGSTRDQRSSTRVTCPRSEENDNPGSAPPSRRTVPTHAAATRTTAATTSAANGQNPRALRSRERTDAGATAMVTVVVGVLMAVRSLRHGKVRPRGLRSPSYAHCRQSI